MSYLVTISDKHIIKKQPTLLDNFDSIFKLLTDEFEFKARIKEDGVIPPFLIELMGRKSKALLLFKNRWTTIY